jgi:transmembrane sensor
LQRPPEAAGTETQAASWLVRLEADASAVMMEQWRKWMTEDARHQAAYVRIENAWRQTGVLERLRPLDGTVDPDVLATFPGLRPAVHPREAVPFRPKLARLAFAALVVITTMVLAIWFNTAKPDPLLRRTDLGGFERATLPDGSAVVLNTNSEIHIRFSRHLREIVLTRGEALFAVAHAEGRPFAVTAGRTTVQALATTFVVRLRPDAQTEVIVSRGRVAVAPDSTAARLLLNEGDDAKVDGQGLTATGRLDASGLDHRLAWTRGQIWLDQNTLAEAVAEFNRYNKRKLILADPALAPLRVGGSFAATDPNAFSEALGRVFGIRASQVQDSSGAPAIELLAPISVTTR